MAELEVQIDARGAERGGNIAVKSLDRIRAAAKRSNDALGRTDRQMKKTARSGASLGQAVGALAGLLAARKIIEYADAWTQVNNRIRLVTDSTQELAAVTEQVFAISQDSRVGLQSTAELYARIARSSDTLGLSQQRVLGVTESVSKAITISGVSADSANAAIVQLGQGLASGALRGDELRSVLEQTPRLARAIADGLGVPIGKLRELGAAGELSAEKVINALESQADVLDAEFGNIDVTIGQAFTNLENSVIRFIGRFGEATGFFDEGARSVQMLSQEIDGLGEDFFEAAFEVSQFVSALAGGFSTLDEKARLFANSVQGVFASIFGDDEDVEAAVQARLVLEKELDLANQVVADGLDERRQIFEKNQEEIRAAQALDLSIAPEVANQAPVVDPKAAKEAEKLRKELERLGASITESVQTPLEIFQAEVTDLNRTLDAGTITSATYQRALQASTDTYRESLPEVIAYNEQLERGAAITEANLTPQEIFAEKQRELNELLGVGAINQETFNRAMVSAREELQNSVAENDKFAKFLEQITIQAARNMQTAFADFLFDPTDEGFDGMVDKFAETLRRMAAEALSAEVFKILADSFSSAGGGAGGGGGGGGLGGLFFNAFAGAAGGASGGSFADGGDFSAGRPILVGEEGPEVITPKSPGTVIPNGAMGDAPNVEVPVTVNNITDPSAIVSAMESGAGAKAIANVIAQNPEAIRRALN
jgi:tape measure domain-containing protein